MRITKTEINPFKRFSEDVIYFEFQAEGETQPHAGVLRITRRSGGGLQTLHIAQESSRGTLTVRYMPGRPDLFCLERFLPERTQSARRNGIIFLLITAGCALCGLVATVRGLTRDQNRRRRTQRRRVL